ncbi:MAG: class I SAM-dependent methyltransferase [Actinomycetota bacterium]|nr:class I SAM-dependent methyltransferase [Actinomycetota bacterium]
MEEHERRYYDLRAPEYDDWYRGAGVHAERDRPGWRDETRALEALVASLEAGRVLDAACGTAFLTRHLRGEVTGLDQSASMLAVARGRCPDVRFVQGDALATPFDDRSFDLVFSAHFYGHLRARARDRFLREAQRLAPRLVVVDSARRADTPAEGLDERILSDGSRHTVYKRYFEPAALAAELGGEIVFAGRWYVAAAA